MTKIDQTHVTRSSTYRWVTAAFGLLFTAIAIGILIVSEFTLGSIIAAAITGFLGIEAIGLYAVLCGNASRHVGMAGANGLAGRCLSLDMRR
jgi:uncharacterized membrane protein